MMMDSLTLWNDLKGSGKRGLRIGGGLASHK